MTRLRRTLAALLLVLAGCLGSVALPAGALPGPGPGVSYRMPVTMAGVDLHDGQMIKAGDTYYLYGTMYSCGFTWGATNTPWCGFGVSTSTSMAGPWSTPTRLFSPQDTDPWTGTTWAVECGSTGAGCFNPRMIVRSGWGQNDGVPILWFNSPADYTRSHANAYNAMGCNSLTGPCGPTAGAPYGSYNKPSLWICSANGDFTIITIPGQQPALICTMPGSASLSIERLAYSGTNGDGYGARNLAGLTGIESPGAWQDAATGTWVMTYSDPNCGYCAGTATGYATAASPYGPWTAPANVGTGAPTGGRRDVSATSCGGQPRTVSLLDGDPWQGIDLWTGANNETSAGLHFEPLYYRPAAGAAGDGTLWTAALSPFFCN